MTITQREPVHLKATALLVLTVVFSCVPQFASSTEPPTQKTQETPLSVAERDLGFAGGYFSAGDHSKALALLAPAIDLVRREGPKGEPLLATLLNARGMVFSAQNELESAEVDFREALEIHRRVRGNSATTLQSALALARLLDRKRDSQPALSAYQQAFGLAAQLSPGDDSLAADAGNELGLYLHRLGKHREADPVFRRVLKLRKSAEKVNRVKLAEAQNNLATNEAALGRLDVAETLYREALAIYRLQEGDQSENVARSISNMGFILDKMGQYHKAETQHREALRIRLAILPPNHPDLATSYSNLASNLSDLGRSAEAEPFLRLALAINIKNFGENGVETTRNMSNLAVILRAQKKYSEAAALLTRAFRAASSAQGPNHPETLVIAGNLAVALGSANKHSEAEPLLRRILAERTRSLGASHPDVATTTNNLASNLRAQGKLTAALALFQSATDRTIPQFGPDHPLSIAFDGNVAYTSQLLSRHADALSHYRGIAVAIIDRVDLLADNARENEEAANGGYFRYAVSNAFALASSQILRASQ